MKPFSKHLSSTLETGEIHNPFRKIVSRSSGIFPVIKNHDFSSKIHFLGYWFKRRNIPEIGQIITLRNNSGEIILRKTNTINSVKAFSVELDDLLHESQYGDADFLGSIEFEFLSTRDLVWPVPALVLEFSNDNFSTCVHSVQRIYNDFEDLSENEQFKVPETGFDIFANDDLHGFTAFVNGPLENKNCKINYIVTNHNSDRFSGSFELGKIHPYETKFIVFDDYIPQLHSFLNNSSGSISLSHNLEGFFPRLLVGNIQKSFPSISITHTYYDCTSCNTSTDYWDRKNHYHDSSVYLPLFLKDDFYTELIFYPIFSPSNFYLHVELYDETGKKLFEKENFLEINTSESKLHSINFKQLINTLNLDKIPTSAHVITNFKENKIPSRLKFGLNVGMYHKKSKLPCNICFNAKVPNPNREEKSGSFHWAPLFSHDSSIITISNSSPKKDYIQNANVEINFFREQDTSSILKKIKLSPFSEIRISNNESDLKNFLQGDGWVTIQSDNPNIQGFYFNFNSSGAVAGDHFF